MEEICGGCCKTCKNGEHLLTIHCKINHVTLNGDGRCYCGGEYYVERTDTLEQRYAQLEHVTKKMLAWCENVMAHYSGEGGTPEDVLAFRDQLKSL